MSAHTSSWYAGNQIERPQGTPGTYEGHVTDTKFEVILDRDGLLWYASRAPENAVPFVWVPMRGWDVKGFTPDEDAPEWAERCTHPTLCTSERDCDALHFEQGSGDW